MLAARQLLGEKGERIAEGWLAGRGWKIVERRFRSGHRDIDLVVEQDTVEGGSRIVAFVEVKTRVSAGFGGPLGAVDWRKQRELVKAARDWMSRFHRPGDVYRFDVVGILFGGDRPEVVHVENAFSVR
jgi:putative endonuclease